MSKQVFQAIGPKFRALGILVAAALVAAVVWTNLFAQGVAQAPVPYPLRHAEPAKIRQQLLEAFERLAVQAEVTVDDQQRRILVRGGADVQQLVATLLPSWDVPSQPAADDSVVKSYRLGEANLTIIERAIRARYGDNPNVRTATDAAGGQLIVRAAPAVHDQVADMVASLPGQRATEELKTILDPNRPTPESSVAQRQPPIVRHTNLRHTTWREFERSLALLGPLATNVRDGADGPTADYDFGVRGRDTVRASIERNTGRISVSGPQQLVMVWGRLIDSLDAPPSPQRSVTQLMPVRTSRPEDVRRLINVIQTATAIDADGLGGRPGDRVAMFFQPRGEANETPPAGEENPATDPQTDPQAELNGDLQADMAPGEYGLTDEVQIEYVEELDIILIRAKNPQDAARVKALIELIEAQGRATRPAIVVHDLKNVGSAAMAELIGPLYEQVLSARQGSVSITALVKPNSLLLIGRQENVQHVVELVEKLDQPVDPATELKVFRLLHASAISLQQTIQQFYSGQAAATPGAAAGQGAQRGGLGARVLAVADFRSNALVVQASPRDMVEIADMIARLDVPDGEAVNQLRIVKLNNSLASDLAPIIQQAILAASEPLQTTQGAQGAAGGAGGNDAQQQRNLQARSLMLQMLTFDENGERRLTSGLLNDVRVTPDPRANALVVSAPSDSMPLLLALIDQLDKMPPAVAQIKVFTVVNADATRLAETLETLYTNQAGADQPAIVTAAPGDQESTLIPLRIAVEPRSNSVIVSGSSGDLTVVEAILLKLDVTDSQKRQTYVYRLNNSYAPIVATAITELLNQRRQLEQGIQADLRSPFELLEREVIVVAEEITNSLIISATQKYYDEVIDWIEKLDERPPMVVIQVVIAEVTLGDVDEFGVQMGLQDSLLFDRSVAGVPGFNFNNAPLGNNVAAAGANRVGTQGLSDLSIGRMNSDLGFGGLVFSASSESVSVLLRALRQERKVQVLSRPQITTLDNQLAFVQVGADVPRVQGTTVATNGSTVNDVVDTPTGVILEVTPRISPDGMVVMEIDAINSRLGPEAEGVPVSIAPNGDVVRQPQIEKITARASIMAADGQTIVFGGLIGTNSETVKRTVPVLGEIPLLRRLFTYELQEDTRRELLFIMTPHIVKNREDLEAIKQIESSRMSWCLSDVIEIHGDGSPGGLGLAEKGLPVVYPDLDPAGENISPPTPTDGPADQFSPPSNLREYQPSLEPAPDTTLNDSRPRDARPRINRLPDADSVDRRETARLPDREETRRFDDRRGYDDQRRPESDYRDRTPYEATPAGYNQPATGPWPPAYR